MTSSLSRHWHEFKARPPGKRFQDIHKQKKGENQQKPLLRYFVMGGGILLTLTGIFLLAVPGPGTLVMVAGLAMLAGESITVARFLDWAEVKLRAFAKAFLKRWKRWSMTQKVLVCVAAGIVLITAAGAIFSYFFMR